MLKRSKIIKCTRKKGFFYHKNNSAIHHKSTIVLNLSIRKKINIDREIRYFSLELN